MKNYLALAPALKIGNQTGDNAMNKKKFEIPTAEITYFEAVDILTSSTEAFDGEWVSIGNKKSYYENFPTY